MTTFSDEFEALCRRVGYDPNQEYNSESHQAIIEALFNLSVGSHLLNVLHYREFLSEGGDRVPELEKGFATRERSLLENAHALGLPTDPSSIDPHRDE